MSCTQFTKQLTHCKISVLNDIAILCGAPILSSSKASRVEGILSQLNFYKSQYANLHKRSTLAIDLGIKNFSFCKSTGSKFPIRITKWDKIDLHDKYGSSYIPLIHENTVFDRRRYLNHIANALVDDLDIISTNVKIMESQRTRSQFAPATLPHVLLLHDLEILIMSKVYPESILPQSSKQMMDFWLYRYITKESRMKLKKNNKIVRTDLAKIWFDKLYSIVDYKDSEKFEKSTILKFLNLDPKLDKADDLIDSLLYNLFVNCQLNNLADLVGVLGKGDDLQEFVNEKSIFHRDLIKPVVDQYRMEYKSEKGK
ncbi:CCE1 [Candida oxycetoniae]|uniref:CCE1 n=1 Tax=Candida oxycetoniae TaxID=497107 RepID=A0AAI9SW18_9ASCO|nr:CCE1 [Candida oxycetoniae]KAI3404007.2 CCE1 [Candida oxycetoniae]